MDLPNKYSMCTTSKTEVLLWVCTTLMNQLSHSLTLHSSLLLIETTPYIWALKTQFWRDMMEDSKISSKLSIKVITNLNSKRKVSGMNTDLLMIWLHMLSNPMEDLYGPARTMMEMSNQILLLKAMDLLVWWPVYYLAQMEALRLRLPTEQWPDITDFTNRERKLQPTLLPQYMLGQEDSHIELNLIKMQNWLHLQRVLRKWLLKLLKLDIWQKI